MLAMLNHSIRIPLVCRPGLHSALVSFVYDVSHFADDVKHGSFHCEYRTGWIKNAHTHTHTPNHFLKNNDERPSYRRGCASRTGRYLERPG